MKKAVWLALLVGLVDNSIAGTMGSGNNCGNECLFKGAYAGIGGGYTQQNIQDDYTQQNIVILAGQSPTFSSTAKINQSSAFGQVFLGYGNSFNDMFYAGVEGGLNIYRKTNNFTPKNPFFSNSYVSTANLAPQIGFQLSALPGYLATPETLIYGRIGYGYESYDSYFTTNIPVVAPQTVYNRQWVSQLILGLGINQQLFDNISGRLEYTYQASANIKGPSGSTYGLLGLGSVDLLNTHQDSYKVSTNNLMLSIVYNFPV